MPKTKFASWQKSIAPSLQERNGLHPLRSALTELGCLLFIFLATPLVVFFDTSVVGEPMSEDTLTERLQAALIVISTLIFATGALQQTALRGYLVAVTTLLACMAIRESDSLFDNVYHGFWLIPALVVLGFGAAFTWKYRQGAGTAFAAHVTSHSGAFFVLGLLLLVVFSRLFGTGAVWEGVMGSAYTPVVKTAVQEGLELLGYFLLTYGAVVSLQERFGERHRLPR